MIRPSDSDQFFLGIALGDIYRDQAVRLLLLAVPATEQEEGDEDPNPIHLIFHKPH